MIRSIIGMGGTIHCVLTGASLANPFLERQEQVHLNHSGHSDDLLSYISQRSFATRHKVEVARQILSMYRCEPGATDNVRKYYAEDAVFEDAACKVVGSTEITSSFKHLNKLKPKQLSHIEEYGEGRVRIHLVQQYTIGWGMFTKTGILPSLVTLEFTPGGAIQRHEELWYNHRLLAVCSPSRWINGKILSFFSTPYRDENE